MKQSQSWHRQLIVLVLAVIAMYVVLPKLGNFRHSLSLLPSANTSELLLAAVFTGLSYLFAAGTYKLLAFHLLHYGRTALVQVAGMFVNRLLPAGIGGIGVNYAYLRKSRHSTAEAASVVAVNNTLGIVGHLLILAVLLLVSFKSLPSPHLYHIKDVRIFIAIAAVAVLAWSVFYYQHKQRIRRAAELFIRQVLLYRKRPRRLSAALACSICLTLCNVLSLWFCVLALHASIPFAAILIVFSFGIILGTATPTPGGLGGIEAGLVAGLVIYHIDGATALAIVLTYRLVSYWLPLFIGAGAFILSERLGYL
ncbi:MAG TPA: YbhN family protein [Candidatus Saccharimonadales bacterium]|nr:YbhN family protein [Candidatus Saccharimonadales bacterium]